MNFLAQQYPSHYMVKFCRDPKAWYLDADSIAEGFGLHEPPLHRVLDIGCGFGYFLYACRAWGHSVEGVDVPDVVIQQASDILGVSVYPHEVRAFDLLPPRFTGYDLVTTFGVNFRHSEKKYWGKDEYTFLAQDIRSRLTKNGRWVLRPNQSPELSYLMDPIWWQEVAGEKAQLSIKDLEVQLQWAD
jgi:SAM-dependent methyltransferase